MRRIKLDINKEDFKKKLGIENGKDGKTPTKKELISIIKPLIPEPKKEVIVEKTEIIKEVTNPQTGEEIVNKINELDIIPDKQIDLKHIGGLDEFLKKNYPRIIPQKGSGLEKVITDSTLTGDGTSENPLHANGGGHTIQDEGSSLTKRTKLNFVGAGVTVTDGGAGTDDTVVTIPGTTISDGDKGDITVSDNGETWTIDDNTITENKLSLSDNTTANVSITKHGLTPKLPNENTKYLNGVGEWTIPYSGGSSGITDITEGAGISIDKTDPQNPVVSNTNPTPYTLPTASASTLGGVKVGSRLSIDDGVLSADAQGDMLKSIYDPYNREERVAFASDLPEPFKVKASEFDTTEGYLASKIASGAGINVTLKNVGRNEYLEIENVVPEVPSLIRYSGVVNIPNLEPIGSSTQWQDLTNYVDIDTGIYFPNTGGFDGSEVIQATLQQDYYYDKEEWLGTIPSDNILLTAKMVDVGDQFESHYVARIFAWGTTNFSQVNVFVNIFKTYQDW